MFRSTNLTSKDVPILHSFILLIYIPRQLAEAFFHILSVLRIVSWQRDGGTDGRSRFARCTLPINYFTAPLGAVLFLLAATVISKREIELGTIGDDDTGICPYDLVIVFLSLGYIANSIGAAGLIRSVVLKALKIGNVGIRSYLYLYICFFVIGAFLGNDPIMVLFLSYFVRAISNITHPRAWTFTQFCIANIATGILVSSNPTNLVLANAFKIRFVSFAANLIVPVIATAVLLFPFLFCVVFRDENLIPRTMLCPRPAEIQYKMPTNPNIPTARERPADGESIRSEWEKELEHILNPFLDRKSALLGSIIFIATIFLLLALNAVYLSQGGNTDFWVTLPAAITMLCWDLSMGWLHRAETRHIVQQRRRRAESLHLKETVLTTNHVDLAHDDNSESDVPCCSCQTDCSPGSWRTAQQQHQVPVTGINRVLTNLGIAKTSHPPSEFRHKDGYATLFKFLENRYRWCQETFPTTTVALRQHPYDLVPFAFCMFILVEALISKGWVHVFAHWWDLWAAKSGPVGCIAGMGFLGVVLSNVSARRLRDAE